MNKLVIFGASFFDLIKLVDAINKNKPTWELIGFIDDKKELQNTYFGGYSVLGGREIIPELVEAGVYFVHNVADTRTVKHVCDLLESHHCKWANLIHPSIDMNYVTIGHGCILPEGCVVGGNANIGNYVIVRLSTLISHDVHIRDNVFIGPGAVIGSSVVLEELSYIGAGATIMLNRTVGAASLIGAGSVVTKDVPPNTIVAGVPAKILKK